MAESGHEVLGSTAVSDEGHLLSELKALAGSPGFIYTLAYAAANTFIREEGSSSHERISVKELTLIAGLLAIQPISTTYIPDEETLTAQMTDLYVLVKKLHDVVAQPMIDGTVSRITARLSAKATQSSVSLDPLIPFLASPPTIKTPPLPCGHLDVLVRRIFGVVTDRLGGSPWEGAFPWLEMCPKIPGGLP